MWSVGSYTAILTAFEISSAGLAFAGEVVQVKISDLAFTPAAITLRIGDTVEWVNGDFIDHTATAKTGEWDVMISAGKMGGSNSPRPGQSIISAASIPT